jgi:hypothetical protein
LTGAPVVTLAVTALVAVAEPAEFVAVTAMRILFETSAATRRYVAPVAPLIAEHPLPEELQRCHCRPNVMVGVPVQVPVVEVSSWPSFAVPETAGKPELTGGVAAIAAVVLLVAGVEPPLFVAVTTTRILDATSAEVRVYVVAVAPAMSMQLDPALSHRCHCRA